MRGSKIIMMEIGNIKFIDSLNYLPMALSALPRAFDLGLELKKGYFPHLFNTAANINYAGPLPDIVHYEPNRMKDAARLEFFEWYKEHKHNVFDMQQELTEYCKSDVDILTRACLKFRKMFITECNVCPFTEAVTIASATNLVFRRKYLKENTIAVIPQKGYRYRDIQSKIAIQWLIWEESRRGIDIKYAAKKQEATVSGVKVDGFCSETNEVFEFHGCYFHGHTCITANRDKPLREDHTDTLNNRYERTVAKTNRLRLLGYLVIEMWECEFRAQMLENNKIAAFTENNYIMTGVPLNPRDAFYGGRTGNTTTYYQIEKGEKIKYVDVCSLYPFICKNGKFPIGHPQVYVGEQCQPDLFKVEGLIKCMVLPPTDLFHPVLPCKMNDRLMFVLCRTCGTSLNQSECTHSEQERALTGTWVIDEIRKAIEKGYKVLEIYEIWSYDVEQYDIESKTGGLFTDMMNKFIKIKQEASGFPSDCTTQEEKDQYIQNYLNNEGVQLEFSKIVKNTGLRSLAKLILNSFWGKFGQRENQSKTSVIRQPSELYDILGDPSRRVNSILEVDEITLIVSWEHIEDAADVLPTVNVAIAAYTTSLARLKLYSYLEQLGNRVLYYDTDSVIYISKEGDQEVPTGSLLGQMTDELEEYGSGSYIVGFASGGPKNYGYVVFSPKFHTYFIICKVKGFCLDFNATKLINFYSMKVMATEEEDTSVCITSTNIVRDKRHSVITKQETKVYRKCSEKRRFNGCGSVPYGYKKLKTFVDPLENCTEKKNGMWSSGLD